MLGRTLGQYRIVGRIGAGGMGVVYRARDDRLDRDVAIKVLPEGVCDEPARRHLRNEARALSRAAHPSIATIHELDSQDAVDFLVMEYIPGQTLAERLAVGALPGQEVLHLGMQLAEGLGAAHAQGVVHCDLKPSNLRITPDGRLKVLDFGLARLRQSEDSTHTASSGARLAGTLPYMAPEQVRGEKPDARTDVYAAGAILYEMATGRRPHAAPTEVGLIGAILEETPTAPSALRRDLSAQLEACILKALDKDPDRRYQTTRELLVDLQRASGPLSAPPGLRERGRPRQAARVRWAPLSGAVVAIAAVGVLALWRLGPQERPVGEGARVRIAILPAQDLSGRQNPGDWPQLVQALLASELTGIEGLGVMDPLSLNTLVAEGLAGRSPREAPPLYAVLKRADTDYAILTQLVASGGPPQLQASLINPATGELAYSVRRGVGSDQDLTRAVSGIAADVVAYLQVSRVGFFAGEDIQPWVSWGRHDIQAVRAFLQASHYIYVYERAEGERYLRRALEIDVSFVAPRLWLISLLMGQGRTAEASEHYQHLVSLEKNASPFEQAMIAYVGASLSGDLEARARHLEVALAYSPNNNVLLANLADVQALQGDCTRALVTLRPAVSVRWRYPPIYPLFGWCAILTDQVDEAREVLNASLDIAPVQPDVYALLEALALARSREADASRYAALYAASARERGMLSLDPAMADAYARLAWSRLRAGAPGVAVALFERAVNVAPQTLRHYSGLAEALRRLGRLDEAQRTCERALAIDPNWANAHEQLAEISEQRGDTAGAIDHYTQFLEGVGEGAEAEAARAKVRELRRMFDRKKSERR